MVVRKNLKLSLIYKFTKGRLHYSIILSLIATFIYHIGVEIPFDLAVPVSIMGGTLGFMLGMKNTSSYQRWIDGSATFGKLISTSRHFAMQIDSFIGNHRDKTIDLQDVRSCKNLILRRYIAFVYALNYHLRRKLVLDDSVLKYLTNEEIELIKSKQNVPLALLNLTHKSFQKAYESRYTEDFEYMQLDNTIKDLYESMGVAEGIKNIILPAQYTFYTKIALWIFLTILPFSVIKELGYFNFPICVSLSFFFIVLEYLGRLLANPFENTVNDVPLDAMCRTIEIGILDVLNEKEIPLPLNPIDGYLF